MGIECATLSGAPASSTGENVICDKDKGLICVNGDQKDGKCNYDYKVKFSCPCCE